MLESPPRGGFQVLSVLSKKLVKTSSNGNEVLHLLKLGKETGSAEHVWAR